MARESWDEGNRRRLFFFFPVSFFVPTSVNLVGLGGGEERPPGDLVTQSS